MKPAPPPPTAELPAVFVLKRKGRAEPLIHHAEVRVRLPLDGSPVFIDLRSGKVGAGPESVVFTLLSAGGQLPLNTFYPYDWTLAIQVPGGELTPREDPLDFKAPEGGYRINFATQQFGSSPRNQWKSEFEASFFARFAAGTHARMNVQVSTQRGFCTLETFLNPSAGSRNLEFSPSLQPEPQ